MKKLRIGIAQLNTKDNISESFRTIAGLTGEIASRGADLAVFPEMSTYLSELDISAAAQHLEDEVVSRFRELAKKHKIYLHIGSFVEKSGRESKVEAEGPGSRAFNTSVFINPEGAIEAVYRKIHLFDIELSDDLSYRESDRFLRGSEIVTHHSTLGDLGFSICYDLRFPELYRSLALRGAKIIFVPSGFTLFTGKDHWEPLLRARAIENQVYIIAPNQIGEHPVGKHCYGNSMIVDPWGKVIARASDRVEAVVANIDLDYVDKVRGKLPSLKNRVKLEECK